MILRGQGVFYMILKGRGLIHDIKGQGSST